MDINPCFFKILRYTALSCCRCSSYLMQVQIRRIMYRHSNAGKDEETVMTAKEIKEMLEKTGYIADDQIAYAAGAVVNERIPLLIEGAPGSGKTSLAEAVAKGMGVELIRVQMYAGQAPEKVLYDYNYQKQLLSIEAIRSTLDRSLEGKTPQEALDAVKGIDFYGSQFLIRRPILKAITSEKPCVLLIDEIDKSTEELEYALLEVLDTGSMSIPEYGTVTCREDAKPMIFLTSNEYRDLSDALKRRCAYLYIQPKSADEVAAILTARLDMDSKYAKQTAECFTKIQSMNLRQAPSISECIAWASYLMSYPDAVPSHGAFLLAKTKEDMPVVTQALNEMFGVKNA